MRVIMITRHGGPEVLEVQERPDPVMVPGHVRIDVAAAGVNFADTMARTGLYPDAPKPPMVVGYEVAGTVREVASDVSDVAVGDRVMAGTKFGGYASEVVVPVANVVPLADRLSFEQGAGIPVNYATAWAALLGYGSLREGERVLIHAAAGGVGIAATQIAKRHGATVHGTASAHKHDRIRSFGVDEAHDYRKRGWDRGLRDRSTSCSTRSAAPRSATPTSCCARAGGSLPTARRACSPASGAGCTRSCRRRRGCGAAST
jgi:NADPH:quinone reductase-like Zn-dependent oxidoreductase